MLKQRRMANDKLIRVFQKPFRLAELTEAILQALEPDIPDGTLKGISASGIFPVKRSPGGSARN